MYEMTYSLHEKNVLTLGTICAIYHSKTLKTKKDLQTKIT